MFIWQLPKAKRYAVYKVIKKYLCKFGLYEYECNTYEYIKEAMSEKTKDLPYEIQEDAGLI